MGQIIHCDPLDDDDEIEVPESLSLPDASFSTFSCFTPWYRSLMGTDDRLRQYLGKICFGFVVHHPTIHDLVAFFTQTHNHDDDSDVNEAEGPPRSQKSRYAVLEGPPCSGKTTSVLEASRVAGCRCVHVDLSESSLVTGPGAHLNPARLFHFERSEFIRHSLAESLPLSSVYSVLEPAMKLVVSYSLYFHLCRKPESMKDRVLRAIHSCVSEAFSVVADPEEEEEEEEEEQEEEEEYDAIGRMTPERFVQRESPKELHFYSLLSHLWNDLLSFDAWTESRRAELEPTIQFSLSLFELFLRLIDSDFNHLKIVYFMDDLEGWAVPRSFRQRRQRQEAEESSVPVTMFEAKFFILRCLFKVLLCLPRNVIFCFASTKKYCTNELYVASRVLPREIHSIDCTFTEPFTRFLLDKVLIYRDAMMNLPMLLRGPLELAIRFCCEVSKYSVRRSRNWNFSEDSDLVAIRRRMFEFCLRETHMAYERQHGRWELHDSRKVIRDLVSDPTKHGSIVTRKRSIEVSMPHWTQGRRVELLGLDWGLLMSASRFRTFQRSVQVLGMRTESVDKGDGVIVFFPDSTVMENPSDFEEENLLRFISDMVNEAKQCSDLSSYLEGVEVEEMEVLDSNCFRNVVAEDEKHLFVVLGSIELVEIVEWLKALPSPENGIVLCFEASVNINQATNECSRFHAGFRINSGGIVLEQAHRFIRRREKNPILSIQNMVVEEELGPFSSADFPHAVVLLTDSQLDSLDVQLRLPTFGLLRSLQSTETVTEGIYVSIARIGKVDRERFLMEFEDFLFGRSPQMTRPHHIFVLISLFSNIGSEWNEWCDCLDGGGSLSDLFQRDIPSRCWETGHSVDRFDFVLTLLRRGQRAGLYSDVDDTLFEEYGNSLIDLPLPFVAVLAKRLCLLDLVKADYEHDELLRLAVLVSLVLPFLRDGCSVLLRHCLDDKAHVDTFIRFADELTEGARYLGKKNVFSGTRRRGIGVPPCCSVEMDPDEWLLAVMVHPNSQLRKSFRDALGCFLPRLGSYFVPAERVAILKHFQSRHTSRDHTFKGTLRMTDRPSDIPTVIFVKSISLRDSFRWYGLIFHEVERLCRCDHPHIVRCYGYTQRYPSSIDVLMEYCDGGLRRYFRPKRSDLDCYRIFRDVTSALVYLHERRMCHLDVRPDNICLASYGNETVVKLVDFGLVRSSGIGLGVSTLPFIHERVRELHDQGDWTILENPFLDLYSLGVTMYALFRRKGTATKHRLPGTWKPSELGNFETFVSSFVDRDLEDTPVLRSFFDVLLLCLDCLPRLVGGRGEEREEEEEEEGEELDDEEEEDDNSEAIGEIPGCDDETEDEEEGELDSVDVDAEDLYDLTARKLRLVLDRLHACVRLLECEEDVSID